MRSIRDQSLNTTNPSSCASSLWRSYAYYTGARPYPNIPHLNGNWRTGQLNDLQKNLANVAQLAAQKGRMCTFWSEDNLMILLSDPALVYEYKTKFMPTHVGGNTDNWDILVGDSITNNKHLKSKGIWHRYITTHLPFIRETAARVTAQHLEQLNKNGEFIINDAGNYFRLFALELAMRIFMGMDTVNLKDRNAIITYLTELFTDIPDIGLMLLNLKTIDTSTDTLKKIDAFKKNISTKFNSLILEENHLSTDSVFYKLWEGSREYRGEQELTDNSLAAEAFLFLTGGSVMTTGDSFPIILQLVCNHPEVKEKLVGLLSTSAKEAEQYLDQIIKEAFRIQPTVAVLPLRSAIKKPFTLDGITFKQGDYVVISPLVNHLDPAVWKNPDKFDPERFSKENAAKIPLGAYYPFGLGPHECPGKEHGLGVLKVALAMFFKDFDISIVNQSALKQDGPTTITSDQLSLRFVERSKEHTHTFKY